MPINCPIPFGGSCEGCPKLDGDTCAWYSPPVPLREILTPHERIDMLEAEWKQVKKVVPSYVLAEIRKDLNNVQGMQIHFQEQFNEYIIADKRKKLQKQAKKKAGGTVEV